ncbi:MAG: DUF839 domain-containing protein [Leptolyngbya sp. SIO4C5]|nr:DUF839 domain-containing protein [Leptolyngbya sp. SIO4C5]
MVSPLEAFYARVAQGRESEFAGGFKYGPLRPTLPRNTADLANTVAGDLRNVPLLELPRGFKYTAFSITGQTMSDGTLVPGDHDGMAAFPGPRGSTILVRNHELSPTEDEFGNLKGVDAPAEKRYAPNATGGTTTLVVGRNRRLVKDYASLSGTIRNCAGGPTPWGSWVSCEETFSSTLDLNGNPIYHGYNFEVPAGTNTGLVTPVALKDMGRFSHEAVAVDPRTGYVYETEDSGDSCFYRFVPNVKGNLAQGGSLYALKIKQYPDGVNTSNNPNLGGQLGLIPAGREYPVEWVKIDNPNPIPEENANDKQVRTQGQEKGGAVFFRGEGAWYGNGVIYFIATQGGPPAVDSSRGNGQVWEYNPQKETVTLIVEAPPSGDTLDEPDNVTVSPFGDLFLCEDGGGEQFVVGVDLDGLLYKFARNNLDESEFAGACFSPDGRTLFVNSQGVGITYAIWGPWTSGDGADDESDEGGEDDD